MIGFGILGVGRTGGAETDLSQVSNFAASNLDMQILYVAGLAWLRGLDAYLPAVASTVSGGLVSADRYDFAYPPQSAPLCLLLAAFPLLKAKALMTTINVFSAVALAFFSLRLVQRAELPALRIPSLGSNWFVPAIILGNPFTANVLWLGQTTLIAIAALVGSWYFAHRDRWLPGGILLAIATLKPQLSGLVILWLLLERRWRLLATASLAILIGCSVPMWVSGPVEVFIRWFAALQNYTSSEFNVLGFRFLFGIQNLLYSLGIQVPSLLPLAVLALGVLWWYRKQLLRHDIFGVLLALSLLFGFSHTYDLVALAPLVALFARHLRDRPRSLVVVWGLMLAMFFPQSWLLPLQVEPLLHWRVLLVLGLTGWLIVLSHQRVGEIASTPA